jgi:hypothetical protein
MTHLSRFSRRLHCPDLFDWAANRTILIPDYRIRWVASRCRVSFATAETIITNAGFFDGDVSR